MTDLVPAPNLRRTLITGLRWVTVSRVIAQVVTWVNTFYVIRLLSPADFGLAALAAVFANFLSLLNELGFSVTLVQRQTRDEESLRHVFGALLTIGAIFTSGLIIAAPLIGDLAREPRIVPLVRFVSIQFVVMAFSVIPQARLSMDMRFRELAATGIASALVGAASTLLMALSGAGAWSLVVGSAALAVMRMILLNVFCPSLRMPRLRWDRIRPFARFSGLVLLERTLWYWYMQIDSFVVGRVLGVTQLGVYAVGKQLTNIPLERAMEIVNSVALPAFSRLREDLADVRAGYLKILRLGAAYAFPVFWGLGAVCDPLIRAVIGTKWIAAIPVIQLLCVSMPLRMLNSFTAAPVTAVGRQDVNIKSLLLAICVIPPGVVIGVHYGVTGAALAWAIGFPLVYLINAALVSRALNITVLDMWNSVWPAGFAAAVMSALLALFGEALHSLHPLAHLALAIPFGLLVFLLTLSAVSAESAREMMRFARDLTSRNRVA